ASRRDTPHTGARAPPEYAQPSARRGAERAGRATVMPLPATDLSVDIARRRERGHHHLRREHGPESARPRRAARRRPSNSRSPLPHSLSHHPATPATARPPRPPRTTRHPSAASRSACVALRQRHPRSRTLATSGPLITPLRDAWRMLYGSPLAALQSRVPLTDFPAPPSLPARRPAGLLQ